MTENKKRAKEDQKKKSDDNDKDDRERGVARKGKSTKREVLVKCYKCEVCVVRECEEKRRT